MKVLFIDVDGVLRPLNIPPSNLPFRYLDLVKHIITATDAKIVISSSWRLVTGWYQELQDKLEKFGLPVYSETPNLCERWPDLDRSHEIIFWLKDHENVTRYAIIDDWKGAMISSEPESFFRTDGLVGLTDEMAGSVIAYLNKSVETV